jgi:hypothetical protein
MKFHRIESGLCVALAALLAIGADTGRPLSDLFPRLVGYDCEGSAAPVYADNEDELPRCAVIERNPAFTGQE